MLGKITQQYHVGPYTFTEVSYPTSGGDNRTGWRFTIDNKPTNHEFYPTLEYAMAAAVGENYTGRRGAGGSGVGTAADWFMRAIGAVNTSF